MVVVGDGPLRRRLEAEHADVVFAGVQRGEALAAHYASADLFVFPSLSETFGNVTLEALASGLPVVAFDTAAASEHVDDCGNGLLAPAGAAPSSSSPGGTSAARGVDRIVGKLRGRFMLGRRPAPRSIA